MNDAIIQLDLTNIYRTIHPTIMDYTFSTSARRTLSRVEHTLGHKTNLKKFWKTEIRQNIFSNHNGTNLEISNRRKIHKNVEIKKHTLKHPMIKDETTREIKKYFEKNKNKTTKPMESSESSAQRKISSFKHLH